VLVFALLILAASFGYQPNTALFSRIVAAVLAGLALALTIRELAGARAHQPDARSQAVAAEPDDVGLQAAPAGASRGVMVLLGWFGAYFAGAVAIGVLPALAIWMFCFLRWNRAALVWCVILPLAVWAISQFLVAGVLGTFFFGGLLFGDRLPRLF
jgi:hypothetical protein